MRVSKEPEIRKQEIIQTARLLFEKQGIAKTTMLQIAEQLSVAKGLVYYYFSSKDELIQAIVDDFCQTLITKLEKATWQGSIQEKLGGIFNVYFQTISDHAAFLYVNMADAVMQTLIKDKLSEIACTYALKTLRSPAGQEVLAIEYPDQMIRVLIFGLGRLYQEGIHDKVLFARLIEQALHLQTGVLISLDQNNRTQSPSNIM